ncbi:hypothetical protein ILUMI_07373 [Ignelater luminosus]|uniref:MARVEL domain-containing protein n=1 Tax=Ignelater luminosus TaxID=2038154 RepID=A0A8K0D412_IGNLU|nr:hypothetical protein ILUMI_07373 [Ignelater luminosus]
MADPEVPAEQNTPTTITSHPKPQGNIRYDTSYIRTQGGILKIAKILLNFVGFICIQCTYLALHSSGKWFSTVSMFGVFVTGILLICYLFHVVEKYYKAPWIKFELFYCSIMAFCLLIASVMTAPMESAAFQAASFFGFTAMILYAFDAYSKYVAMKSGALAQVSDKQKSKDKETPAVPAPTNSNK